MRSSTLPRGRSRACGGARRAWRRWRRATAGSRRSPGGSPRPPARRVPTFGIGGGHRHQRHRQRPSLRRTARARRSRAPSSGPGPRRRRPRRRRAPADRLVQPQPGDQRLGARDHDEIARAARRARRLHLAGVLLGRHELAPHAGVEAAALGELVVLDADARGAGALELARRAHHVDGVAVAVVAVGDDGDRHRVADPPHGVERLGEREDVGVRHRLHGRDAEPARPDRVEPGLFGELRGERVVGPRRQRYPGPPEQPPQTSWHRGARL